MINKSMQVIRDASTADFKKIVEFNMLEELHTSPMDLMRLNYLHCVSCFHKVATVENRMAGFLLAMRESASYESENFIWFKSRFEQFIYIDRIVISAPYRGEKLGSALYTELFEYARLSDAKLIACEINVKPPNLGSQAFHARWGFIEVGSRHVSDLSKTVSMHISEVNRPGFPGSSGASHAAFAGSRI